MRSLLQYLLAFAARALLAKYQPEIIAITGSVGKTSVKDAVYCVLVSHFSTRKTPMNLNTEFGVPMTIIGGASLPKKTQLLRMAAACVALLFRTVRMLLSHDPSYPRILVIEMGANKPGDIEYLVNLAPPHIAILTAIQPAHLEGFKTLAAIEKEKKMIYSRLTARDWAIVNADDPATAPPSQTPACIFRFSRSGKKKGADISIANVVQSLSFQNSALNACLSFHVAAGEQSANIELPGVIGEQFVAIASYAIGVGLIYGIPLESIAHALARYIPPKGRMRLIGGIKDTLIIDDTYNASPAAMKVALDTLERFDIDQSARRWAILGDMFEMGESAEDAHRDTGVYCGGKAIDFLVCVGPHSRILADGARASGLDESHIFRFDDPVSAAQFVQEKIKIGDILLIKGSQGTRLEKCVKELMAEPERARELLVRQSKEWN